MSWKTNARQKPYNWLSVSAFYPVSRCGWALCGKTRLLWFCETTYAACRWQKSQTESGYRWHILNAVIIIDPPQVPGPAFIRYQITTPSLLGLTVGTPWSTAHRNTSKGALRKLIFYFNDMQSGKSTC